MIHRQPVRFIGDVHGKMDRYAEIAHAAPRSIQLGDFGAGFVPLPELGPAHRFIRGNHDDPQICAAHPSWIRDGSIDGDMFFLGGAASVDRDYRTPGLDWWSDEELSWPAFYPAIDAYAAARPRIVVSHDAPGRISRELFMPRIEEPANRTQQALEQMLDIHAPELWLFGHWHFSRTEAIGKTRFVCLSELDHVDVDLESLKLYRDQSFAAFAARDNNRF